MKLICPILSWSSQFTQPALYSRFLKNHNLYELVAVKDKIGDDGKWHPLEFRCLECNAVQTASTGSLSNLRRHMARMHMARINDYEDAWSKQRGARRSSKILYQARINVIQGDSAGLGLWLG